jgi:uncharacterized protein DUF3467
MAKAKAPSDAKLPAPDRTGNESSDPQIIRANVKRKNERAESFVALYANDAQFRTTPWDIRITFGSIAASAESDKELVVKELSEVYMSPQFAKRVAMVLLTQIQHYERTIGPIPLPED